MTTSNEAKPNRRATLSWALWDWAEQPYPTIIQTFIFATYITSSSFGDPDTITSQLGIAGGIAGLIVALTAPVFGRRSDESGHRKRWLLVNSGLLIAIMVASYFVAPSPSFLLFGLVLYALGSVVQETAFINYYAMLKQVSHEGNVGRISGFAWGLGYVGGIILLLISLVGWVLPAQAEPPTATWFNVPLTDALNYRVLFLFAAAWMLVFTIPLALFVPEVPAKLSTKRESIAASYKATIAQFARLAKTSPDTFKFLIASAIYRDGLAGVFTFGAILGTVSFGFSKTEVIFFGIAANIVAGIGAALGGYFDDRIGTKNTIVVSLVGLLIAGTSVFVLHSEGQIIYWIFGLILCLFVGPAQASSRTFVARFTPAGREGEVFGMYQTTGRAASFLSPTLFALAVSAATAAGIEGASIYGIIGIVLVLLVGLVYLLRVHPRPVMAHDA